MDCNYDGQTVVTFSEDGLQVTILSFSEGMTFRNNFPTYMARAIAERMIALADLIDAKAAK